MSLNVLREDGPLLAVDKPAGLLTQGVPQGLPTLESEVRAYLKERYAKPGNVYLGIPHRLDRPTSGVIVFARNSKAAARLAEQFHDRRVRKEYVAVTSAVPDPAEGLLEDWLLKDVAAAHVTAVRLGTEGAKSASLRYRVLATDGGRAIVRIEPLTGRMHQIRVQFAARGWPVVGDIEYGGPAEMPLPEGGKPGDAIALHARRLTLFHPVRYDELTVEAAVPPVWAALGFDPSAF